MSLVERWAKSLLDVPAENPDLEADVAKALDRQRVLEALELLRRGLPERSTGTPSKADISPELWVLCAEACIRVGALADAADSLHRLFTMNPPTNQFLVRAYCCQAVVEDDRIKQRGLRGDEASAQCLRSVSFVMRALAIATDGAAGASSKPDRYQFLVHNISVAWWRVSRPNRAAALYATLAPSLEMITAAVEACADKDVPWLAQLCLCLAQCYEDADNEAEANKAGAKAAALAMQAEQPRLAARAFQMQIHAGRKSGGGLKLKGEGSGKAHLKVPTLLQLIVDKLTVNDDKNPGAINADLMECVKTVDPDLHKAITENSTDGKAAAAIALEADVKPSQEALDMIAEVARVAVVNDCMVVAEACVRRAALCKSLRSRVITQYVNASMRIAALGVEQNRYTKKMVAVRLDILGKLEQALQSAERLAEDDLDVIQEGCLLVLNVARPLLQPNLRVQPVVQRALFRASKVLDERDSSMHEARAILQLELARAAVDEDFVSRAEACVDKALELNYKAPEYPVTGRDRPLDDRLVPLKLAMKLKSSIYDEPQTDEQKVILLLENARDSKSPATSSSFLTRAASILDEAKPPLEEMANFRLWFDLTKQAWANKLVDLAENGCDTVLPASFDGATHKELVVATAQLYFIQGEVAVHRLQEKGLTLDRPTDEDSEHFELREVVNDSFCSAIGLGLEINESWIVINGVTYIWNYYLSNLRAHKFAEVSEVLETCFEGLKSIDTDNVALLCYVADAFACSLEHSALLAKFTSDHDVAVTLIPDYSKLRASNEIDAASEELTKATDVCTYVVGNPKPSISQQKSVIRTMRRIQKWKGMAAPDMAALPTDEAKVEILLCACDETDQPPEAKADLVQQAMAMMEEQENGGRPELWSRLALAALDCGQPASAATCSLKCCELVPQGEVARAVYGENPANWLNWRWFSIAESVHGQALIALLDPLRQDKTDLDKIKRGAMDHFTTAAEYGCVAIHPELVESAARHFWGASLDFQKNAVTRKVLPKMLRAILNAILNCKGDVAVQCKVRFYEALLTCYRDGGKWKKGLALTDEAFKTVPSTHHRTLWDQRVVFMTKMGVNLMGAMLKVKEMYSERMLARVWISVARVSTDKLEQFEAYNSAIDALAKTPWEAVDYRIEYAEWLFCKDFPVADAEDQLMAVCDLLLAVEDPSIEDADQFDGNSTSRSGTSRSQSYAPSATTRSAKSSAGSTAGSAAKSVGAPRPEKLDVSHHEILMRVYLMLTSIAESRASQIEYSMLALDRVKCIWQQTGECVPDAESPIPAHEAGWVHFQISEELREAMKTSGKGSALNKETLGRPELFFVYGMQMVELLSDSGFPIHCLPVLGMLEVVANDVLVVRQRPLLVAWVHLETARILNSIGVCEEAAKRKELAVTITNGFSIDVEVLKICQDEMKQRKELKNSLTQIASSSGSIMAEVTNEPEKLLRPITDRWVWNLTAASLITEGYFKEAKMLLEIALEQAKIFDDDECICSCNHYLARVAYWEEDLALAIHLETNAQDYDGDLKFWYSSNTALAEYLEYSGQTQACKQVLDESVNCMKKIMAQRPSSAADAKLYGALCLYRKAKFLMGPQGPQGSAFGIPFLKRSTKDVEEAVELLKKIVDILGEDGSLIVVDIYTDLAELQQKQALQESATNAIQASRTLSDAIGNLKAAEAVAKQVLLDGESTATEDYTPPTKRQLARVYVAMATVELLWARMQAQIELEESMAKIDFPRVEGGDEETMKKFMLKLEKEAQKEPLPSGGMSHDAQAILYFNIAANLDRSELSTASTELGIGRALRFQAKTVEERVAACEKLKSATDLARQHDYDYEVMALASSESLGCYFDQYAESPVPADSAAHAVDALWQLSLHQSCRWAQQLRQYYIHACPPSHADVFSMKLRQKIGGGQLPAVRVLDKRLEQAESFLLASSASYKALQNSATGTLQADGKILCGETEVDLPETVKFVTLQHTDDGSELLVAAFGKSDLVASEPAPLEDGQEAAAGTALPVRSFQANPAELAALREEAAKFKTALQKFTTDKSKEVRPGVGLADSHPRFGTSKEVSVAWAQHLSRVSSYFEQVLPWLTKQMNLSGEQQVVLLLDPALAELPVDALTAFAPAASCSRDFSLGMFCHRMSGVEGASALSKSEVTYVVDPFAEGFKDQLEPVVGKGGWTGAQSEVPDVSEIKSMLTDSGPTFFFFGSGSARALVGSAALATTTPACHAMVLIDQYDSDKSIKLASENALTDVEKTLDLPLITAGLLSLQGAKSIVLNQWAAKLDNNVQTATTIFDSMLGGASKPIGIAVQDAKSAWIPAPEPAPEPASEAESEAETEAESEAEPESEPEPEVENFAYNGYNTMMYGLPHLSM